MSLSEHPRICLIGAGNIATFLGTAFQEAGHVITGVFSRQPTGLAERLGVPAFHSLIEIPDDTEVVCIAVSDDAIPTVYDAIAEVVQERIVVHHAGSVSLNVFQDHPQCGVLWPVQSITRGRYLRASDVPIVITAPAEPTYIVLDRLVRSITPLLYRTDDAHRQILHLGATIVNNFTNHLYVLTEELLSKHDIPFDILQPIIEETARKIQFVPPTEAQTGAAIRGDLHTLEQHLRLLEQSPQIREVYLELSRSILEHSRKG